MSFSRNRDHEVYGQPITPVLKCEEEEMQALFPRFLILSRSGQARGNVQHGAFNCNGMAEEWNIRCLNEFGSPVLQCKKMYPKTAQLIKQFHNMVLRRKNERETLHHRVTVEGVGGDTQDVAAREGVEQLREKFRTENLSVRIDDVQEKATNASHLRSTQFGSRLGERVGVPLAGLLGAAQSPVVQHILGHQHHIIMPAGTQVGKQKKGKVMLQVRPREKRSYT
jgi:hypothetical protein